MNWCNFYSVFRIRIDLNTDPNPDPDPAFQVNTDPDPAPDSDPGFFTTKMYDIFLKNKNIIFSHKLLSKYWWRTPRLL